MSRKQSSSWTLRRQCAEGQNLSRSSLTTAEETELRSVTGSLQWLVASQTRPDIAVEKKQDNSTRHWSSASLLRNTAWCSKMWQSIKPPCWQATQTAPGKCGPSYHHPCLHWSGGQGNLIDWKSNQAHGSVDPPCSWSYRMWRPRGQDHLRQCHTERTTQRRQGPQRSNWMATSPTTSHKELVWCRCRKPTTTESEPTWTFAASRSISTIRPFTGCRGPCSGPMDWRNSRRHFDLFFSNGLCDHSSNCQQRITKRKTHQCQHLSIQHMQIHDPSHRQRIVTWLCALKSQVRTSSQ